jgi:RNA polymerase sigma-70 factor, ECF subfamily
VLDTTLVNRARTGDDAAWEGLVRAHQQPVFRLAYLLLGDAADAEDVAQEAFMRAFAALDRFDATRPLQPWLLQITSNLARNRRRAGARYLAALVRLSRSQPTSNAPLTDRSDEQWAAHTLWQAVRRLRHVEQEVIYMRYFLELSEADMAAALNIAPGTVKSRLSRAMQRLRTIIDREFPALREERMA